MNVAARCVLFVFLSVSFGCGEGGSEGGGDECFGCMSSGVCVSGRQQRTCGEGGGQCIACGGGDVCIDGACFPTPCEDCAGCCEEDGACNVLGDSAGACGVGGVSCEQCGEGACESGRCVPPCGPANCNGCCSDAGDCVLFVDQGDSRCGARGESCINCSADGEVCGLVFFWDESEMDYASAGGCNLAECASCAPGCCVTNLGGGFSCYPGDGSNSGGGQTICGSNGQQCEICFEADGEACVDGLCVPDVDVSFELRLLSAEVPAKNDEGGDWDRWSPPDLGVIVRVLSTPTIESELIDGQNNNLSPLFTSVEPVTATRAEFQDGILFDFFDRDFPSKDDPMGTIPNTAFVPSNFAFTEFAAPVVLTAGEFSLTFQFTRVD